MRVLHTSDWHIGRRFNGRDLLEYQRNAIDWLADTVASEGIDVVLISGDVFDRGAPPSEAFEVVDDMTKKLCSITSHGAPVDVVMIPGNHDSAKKLAFRSSIARENFHIRYRTEDVDTPFILTRGDERLAVYGIPFLDPDTVRSTFERRMRREDPTLPVEGNLLDRTQMAVIGQSVKYIRRDLAKRRASDPGLSAILMAHTFVASKGRGDVKTLTRGKDTTSDQYAGETLLSDSETRVGGVDSVPAEFFAESGLDYLALGHIHRPQRITVVGDGQLPLARYSGSPVAYSFSEAPEQPVEGNGKTVVVFDIDQRNVTDMHFPVVDSGQPPFVSIKGDLDDILGDKYAKYRPFWVSITASYDPVKHHDARYEVESAFPNILEKKLTPRRTEAATSPEGKDEWKKKNELEHIEDFVTAITGAPPDDAEKAILRTALTRAQRRMEDTDPQKAPKLTRTVSKRRAASSKRATANPGRGNTGGKAAEAGN